MAEEKKHLKKLLIDTEVCIACGNCETSCPEVFKVDHEKNHAVVITDDYEKYTAKIEDAIDECPVQAISWQE